MMFWLFNNDKPWFRAKKFGLGAGAPIAWQGWVVIGLHLALFIGITILLHNHRLALIVAEVTVALLPLPLYAARTEGGWHWRWGGDV